MTELERLEKFKIVQERVNGPEAGLFKNRYDGRFFDALKDQPVQQPYYY